MRSNRNSLLVVFILALALVACTPGMVVKTAQITKATAEQALYDARVMMNKGAITPAQFLTVQNAYDAFREMQNGFLDARIKYDKSPTQTNLIALNLATEAVTLRASTFIDACRKLGIGEGVIWSK